MVDFTVAIPTYNGAERLPQLLERLKAQTDTENFSWIILVVDNNSKDNTADVIRHYQTQWKNQQMNTPPIEYVFEKRQGVAFARLKAVETAQSKWVSFMDDDIMPELDWVAQAYEFGKSRPHLGSYGGQVHGSFEVEPPTHFDRIKSFLAIRERGMIPHRYEPDKLSLPSAAAWVVLKQAWEENVPTQPKLVGRVNGAMVAGDDYEALLYIHKANWEIWYNPAMQVTHKISKDRLERSYLTTLSRGCGLCICQLRMINANIWQKPIVFLRLILSNLRRVIQHWIKYRNCLQNDLVAACEMEFFVGSLISPFHYLRTLLSSQK